MAHSKILRHLTSFNACVVLTHEIYDIVHVQRGTACSVQRSLKSCHVVSQRGQKTIPVQPRVHPGRATATFVLQFFLDVGFGADDAGLAPPVQRRSLVFVAL